MEIDTSELVDRLIKQVCSLEMTNYPRNSIVLWPIFNFWGIWAQSYLWNE